MLNFGADVCTWKKMQCSICYFIISLKKNTDLVNALVNALHRLKIDARQKRGRDVLKSKKNNKTQCCSYEEYTHSGCTGRCIKPSTVGSSRMAYTVKELIHGTGMYRAIQNLNFNEDNPGAAYHSLSQKRPRDRSG